MTTVAARPNVENVTYDELRQRLLDMLQQFNGLAAYHWLCIVCCVSLAVYQWQCIIGVL